MLLSYIGNLVHHVLSHLEAMVNLEPGTTIQQKSKPTEAIGGPSHRVRTA